ncbi:DUF6138 family protein [Solibacillus sp. FSL K6-1523]|uniref:DUF6138 family protein n=1 Tax=Solibacillus sp. FSL K6-1523 TaxID=2921471 RepID=UPI0030F859EA
MEYLKSSNFTTHEAVFQQAITEIQTDRCKFIKEYPTTIKLSTGESILADAALQFYLNHQLKMPFSYAESRAFCEKIRQNIGFEPIRYTLQVWIEDNIQKPNFTTEKKNWETTYSLIEGIEPSYIREELLDFVCYVAVCYMKFGADFDSISAERLYNLVEATGSSKVANLRENGSGDLSLNECSYLDIDVDCFANDAFAIIDIKIKNENLNAYENSLDFMNQLLDLDFPRSYQIQFSSSVNECLPIENLPDAPVHHFFANALAYPELHPKIEVYAEKSMRTYSWYTDLEDENCAMPSTFAVLGLGLISSEYWPLVQTYMDTCDDEHSSIQTAFTPEFIKKFGFTYETLPIFISCVLSVQEHEPHTIFEEKMNDKATLELLLSCKNNFVDYLSESQKDAWKDDLDGMIDYVWQNVIYAIWGVCFSKLAEMVIDSAPEELKPLYREILQ